MVASRPIGSRCRYANRAGWMAQRDRRPFPGHSACSGTVIPGQQRSPGGTRGQSALTEVRLIHAYTNSRTTEEKKNVHRVRAAKVAWRKLSLIALGVGCGRVVLPDGGLRPTTLLRDPPALPNVRAEGLLDRISRAKVPHANRIAAEVEEPILTHMLTHPTHGAHWVADELTLRGARVSSGGLREGVCYRQRSETPTSRHGNRESPTGVMTRRITGMNRISFHGPGTADAPQCESILRPCRPSRASVPGG